MGAASYLTTFAITATYHVPRNNALARLDPTTAHSARAWVDYTRGWRRWNHVLAVASLAAAAALAASV